MDAGTILARMRAVLAETKRVRGQLRWLQGNRPRKRTLVALVEGPTTMAELHVTAIVDLPNEDVSFQLCVTEGGDTLPITRFDWRPPRTHTNKVGRLRGLSSYTGLHPLEENAELGVSAMISGNLPVQVPVADPADFPAAVAYVCATFNLELETGLPLPPWVLPLNLPPISR